MKKYLLILFIAFGINANANVTMPLLFNDGMVLQRNKPISVWGWADANEKVQIHFHKQTVLTKADKNGKWLVALKPEIAGGPFKMTIKGKNTIAINNILVGEVWICSGQSNMEFTVANAMNAAQEINDANFPMIRQFLVEKDMSATPNEKLKSGYWKQCNKNNVGEFTAVGYYFAKKIYARLKVPVGIINATWGGTCVETWTSREAFQKSEEFKDMIAEVPLLNMESISKSYDRQMKEGIEKIQGSEVSTDGENTFKDVAFNDNAWSELETPGLWTNKPLEDLDGIVWMRKTITLTADDIKNKAILRLAKIDDEDITYINGIEVGKNKQWTAERIYTINDNILKEGKNIIAVRIVDNSGGGGIYGEKEDLNLTVGSKIIPLDGKWKFKVIAIKTSLSPNSQPNLLYNAMINPLIPYTFKGVLWYQGEANSPRADQYKKAFPLMITDWRTKWNQGNFPFYFVQLSSFDEFGGNSQKGSRWAELREAQTETLKLPNTGMAVTIDIGNAKDIHPTNKQDVGKRLAAIALNNTYGNKKGTSSGPMYKAMEINEYQIILSFASIGNGLSVSDKEGRVKGFEIAGADKVFYPAKAIIKDNKVIVSSENVPNPVAVHYGWADDAGNCNLYNADGFPASPFRTDSWDTITKGVKYNSKN